MAKVAGQQRKLATLLCPAGRRSRPAGLLSLLFLDFGLSSSSQMNEHTHFLSELDRNQ